MADKEIQNTQTYHPENDVNNFSKPVTHRAEWVVVEKNKILQNGYVIVQNGFITEVGKGSISINGPIVDHGDGVLLPGLVNAHTHLELSALKNEIQTQNGFQAWVRELVLKRAELEQETIQLEAAIGIDHLLSSGCTAVGEISTLGITQDLFMNSQLLGVWFQELLGNHPDKKLSCRKGPRQSISLAGHAPHTTSPALLGRIKTLTSKGKLPFPIHLAESQEENVFIANGRGEWADYLKERGIDFSFWNIGNNITPVQYSDQMGILDSQTLAVHVIHANETDIQILEKNRTSVCLCLRSNHKLHGTLPDVISMLKSKINLCLGTDSLASVDSLSIFDEMAFAANHFPEISPFDILEMATKNGAKALGLTGLTGTLLPGEIGTFLYLDLSANSVNQLLESIVHSGLQAPLTRIAV
jgi:cytosine/adenosine deaminase-related metal-dependent hydrolase